MHHQNRNIDSFEIIEKRSFRQSLDTVVLSLYSSHHSLAPPIVSNALRNFCAGAIESIKRHGDVLVELGTMVRSAVAQLIEHRHREAVGIFVGLQQLRWDRADEHGFGDAALSVLCDVARHLAAACGVTDVNGVFEIERFREFGTVGCVGVHVVAGRCLSGTAVGAAVMRNYAVTTLEEEHHLGIPVVSGERPSMMEKNRLARAPILEINLRAVFHCYEVHLCSCRFYLRSGFFSSVCFKYAGTCD